MTIPTHVSDAVKRRNPHLYGPVAGLQYPKRQPTQAPALDKATRRRPGGQGRSDRGHHRPEVTIVSYRRRLITDADNLIAGAKPLRDAVARWLGIDDADDNVQWDYRQVQTRSREGTAVMIRT